VSGVELVRESTYRGLVAQLGGDPRVVRRMADDFARLWPERMRRLERAVARDDAGEAVTVLRSVRSTAAMLGADRVTDAVGLLLDGLASDRMIGADELVDLRELGRCTGTRFRELDAA
jgi:hypothetical protein